MANRTKTAKRTIHNSKNECPYSISKRLLVPLKFKHGYPLDYPQYVWIDITNECNLKCIMCPQSKGLKRRRMAMEMSTFIKIIDQVCVARPRVVMHVSGEPMLHKDVFKMIRYAKDKGCDVTMFTNATLLTEKASEEILNSSLDGIYFSFDGCSPEIYEKLRVGADFYRVKSNIEAFLRLRCEKNSRKPAVTIEIILMKETRDKIEGFIEYWKRTKADRVAVRLASTWRGLVDDHRVKTDMRTFGPKPCDILLFGCAILAEGTVVACCRDVEGKLPLGNILEQSFDEIWNGKAYNELRAYHFRNTIPEDIICHSCAHTVCWSRKEKYRQEFVNLCARIG